MPRLDALVADLSRSDEPVGAYHDRLRAPHGTLERIGPHLAGLGITRVGLLTGLDVLGIPVAFATRPNSRSLSVLQGKGIDVDAALASAAMEAVETATAEAPPPPDDVATLAEAEAGGRSCIDLDRVARCNPDRIDRHRPMPWTTGIDLMTGAAIRVPWWLVGLDHREPRPAGFEQSSDGLASGNGQAEAVLHALCELVERDAWALLRLSSDAAIAAARIDPRAFADPVLDVLVDRIERAGMTLVLVDMTTDAAIPAYCALLIPGDLPTGCDMRWAEVCSGCGCHPSAVRAAVRAVTEAAQSRLAAISGARDDLSPRIHARAGLKDTGWIRRLAGAPPRAPRPPSADAGATIQDKLWHVVRRLRAIGIEQAVAVPMAGPAGVSVMRVVVPGLEVETSGADIQLGLRAALRIRTMAA